MGGWGVRNVGRVCWGRRKKKKKKKGALDHSSTGGSLNRPGHR